MATQQRKVASAKPASTIKTPTATKAEYTPKRKGQEEKTGRQEKIYSVIKGSGIWYKLTQGNITIYDNQSDKVREIRYCENEPSVFADEQSSNAIRSHIVFREGLLIVPPSKSNLQDYLALHPHNKENGGSSFTIINKEAKATVELDKEFLLIDAVSIVRDKSIDELLPLCMYLNIDVNQRNNEIRRELLLEAKGNPKNFIELLDNPYVRSMSAIKQAVDYNILKSKEDGMYWMDSGRLIVTTPVGQDTVTVTTRFCMTEKGLSAYDEIVNRLQKID
jgi:hypothetical protein|tara:strand:+ start:2364 stop:3194 length:831 start_codon:yes stop_codon:yes gene_type:complete